MNTLILIGLFTLLSGVGDAYGFLHAGNVWRGGGFVFAEAVKSAVGFQCGVLMYWFAVKWLAATGVVAAEVQTLVWFVATIVGIALLSGQFLRWAAVDQLAAVLVLVGIGWLTVRTAT